MSQELITEPLLTKHITLLQALASTPADVARVFVAVGEAGARQIPAPAEWSMVDVLGHLVDIEARYRARLERVIHEEKPAVPALRPDEAAHASGLTLLELLDRFRGARVKTLTFLEGRSLEDWQRPALHATFGEITFRFLVQNLVDHDALHLNQLIELQQQICRQGQTIK